MVIHSTSPARVLVVDDDPLIRDLLQSALVKGGHNVAAVDNGEAALALLPHHSFDLILLDLHMPGMDGMTFLQLLRRQSPHPPVLIISGYVTFDSAAEAGRLGIAGVLKKPFSTADLLRKIRPILELRIESPAEYIRAYFSEPPSREALARRFGVSSRTLLNQIRQQTGQSFRDFLYSCRIQEAQRLLAETSLRVKEIYPKVGFHSPQVFARAFKRQTGCSPRQYRHKTRRS